MKVMVISKLSTMCFQISCLKITAKSILARVFGVKVNNKYTSLLFICPLMENTSSM